MTTTATTTAANPQPNVPTAQDFERRFKELGKRKGQGGDAQVAALFTFFEGTFLNVLDLAKNKHGSDVDDAAHSAAVFAMEQGTNSMYDTKASTTQKLASMMRAMGKLGQCTKFGVGQPLDVVNEFEGELKTIRKNPAMKGKLKDGAQAVVEFARAQTKAQRILSKQEFTQFLLKKQRDATTEEDYLASLRKAVGNHKAGKVFKLDADTADAIVKACNKRLKAIAEAKAPSAAKKAA